VSSNPLNIEIKGLNTNNKAKSRDLDYDESRDNDESEGDDTRDKYTSIKDTKVIS
jgi:hypothetical protein